MAEINMQAPGEICDNCKDRWKKRDKPPIKLKRLPQTTLHHEIVIPVCDYCDGPVRQLAVAHLRRHG